MGNEMRRGNVGLEDEAIADVPMLLVRSHDAVVFVGAAFRVVVEGRTY